MEFYIRPEANAVIGQRGAYPNADLFFCALNEAANYFGDDWHRKGTSFRNYVGDLCPALYQELSLLRMYFDVREPGAEPNEEKDLYAMRRYGRCTLPDAAYLVGTLARLRNAPPISLEALRRADADHVPLLRQTMGLQETVAQFRLFEKDPDDRAVSDELLYGFKALRRIERGNEGTNEFRQNIRRFLVSNVRIAPEDAERFADVLLMSSETTDAASRPEQSPYAFTVGQRSTYTGRENAPPTYTGSESVPPTYTGKAGVPPTYTKPSGSSVVRDYRRWIAPALMAVALFLILRALFPTQTPSTTPQTTTPVIYEEPNEERRQREQAEAEQRQREQAEAEQRQREQEETEQRQREQEEEERRKREQEEEERRRLEAELNASKETRLATIIAECHLRAFDSAMLNGFDKTDCSHARNAVYAHAGLVFSDGGPLQQYYSQYEWYRGTIPPEDFSDFSLNRYETINLYRILAYETACGYRSERYVEAYNRLLTFINNCDRRYFDASQLEDFDADMCRLARYAIYAKSGGVFSNEYLSAYFEEFVTWYNPSVPFNAIKDSDMNTYQLENYDMVVKYERDNGFW